MSGSIQTLKTEISRGDVWDIILDPIKGSEQSGIRPCVVVSPDTMNSSLETVVVVPLSTKKKDWPTRVDTLIDGVEGQALCEQIRTVTKERFKKRKSRLKITEIVQIKLVLKQMFFD